MSLLLPTAFDLSGRVALVTGGGGFLGVEHGLALAAIGATVVLADIQEAAAQSAADRINREVGRACARGIALDVTDESMIESVADSLDRNFGTVRVLVNNAAVDPKVRTDALVETSRLEHFPLDQWRDHIAVGLTGAFLCARIFGGRMARAGGGVILNIASDLSVFGPDQRLYRDDRSPRERQPVKPVTYSVVKTALLGLTRYLATYWADSGVRSNALSPGGVFDGQNEVFVRRLENLIPMGRMARRDEYHAAVQFLCSDASSYMTGQNIVIDGGRSVW